MRQNTLVFALMAFAFAILTFAASDCSAQRKDRRKGMESNGEMEGQQRGQRQRGQQADQQDRGQRGQKQRGQQAGGAKNGDPARRVAQLISQFDTDNDQKLDATELQAMLAQMQQRRRGSADGGQNGEAGKGKGNKKGAGSKDGERGGRGSRTEPRADGSSQPGPGGDSPRKKGGKRGKKGQSDTEESFEGVKPKLPPKK